MRQRLGRRVQRVDDARVARGVGARQRVARERGARREVVVERAQSRGRGREGGDVDARGVDVGREGAERGRHGGDDRIERHRESKARRCDDDSEGEGGWTLSATATFEGLVLYVSQRLNLVLLLFMEESLLVA